MRSSRCRENWRTTGVVDKMMDGVVTGEKGEANHVCMLVSSRAVVFARASSSMPTCAKYISEAGSTCAVVQ